MVVQTFLAPFNSLTGFGNRDLRLIHSVVSPHSGQERNKARRRCGDNRHRRTDYAVHGLTSLSSKLVIGMYDIRVTYCLLGVA